MRSARDDEAAQICVVVADAECREGAARTCVASSTAVVVHWAVARKLTVNAEAAPHRDSRAASAWDWCVATSLPKRSTCALEWQARADDDAAAVADSAIAARHQQKTSGEPAQHGECLGERWSMLMSAPLVQPAQSCRRFARPGRGGRAAARECDSRSSSTVEYQMTTVA